MTSVLAGQGGGFRGVRGGHLGCRQVCQGVRAEGVYQGGGPLLVRHLHAGWRPGARLGRLEGPHR